MAVLESPPGLVPVMSTISESPGLAEEAHELARMTAPREF